MKKTVLVVAGLFSLVEPAAFGQLDLSNASLEQLMDIEVTSVNKKEQKLARTAAAVFVISQEDIRRSGATGTFPTCSEWLPASRCRASMPMHGLSASAGSTRAIGTRC